MVISTGEMIKEDGRLHTAMIASWERTLPMKRSFLPNGANPTDPILIYELIVIPDSLLLLLGFL